jgi:ubiquinone biosynthesis protein
MNSIRRFFQIWVILLQHNLHRLPIIPPKYQTGFQLFRFFLPPAWHSVSGTPAQRTRKAFEALGPLWVKLGQLLSTRQDILPPDFAKELAELQDNVPTFPTEEAIQSLEQSLGKPLGTLFATFDLKPLAAASIAQVHTATLFSGEKVAVKILRPDIQTQVRQDCALLQKMATLLSWVWPQSRRFKPREVASEISQTLIRELNLRQEAANASLLARHFQGSPLMKVPTVYWDYCHTNILVTELIDGIQIDDIPALQKAGISFQQLAEQGVEIFFTQVFQHRFFHADMHPGNIFIVGTPYPRYAAVDFGIMGSLTVEDQTYLALNFLAFFNQDYAKVAAYHVESGWVSPTTDIRALEADFRCVLEPIFAKPLQDISFGHMLLQLLQVAKQHDMRIQPQLLLLQKTMISIEGLGRQLYPELDLWKTAKPFLERWAKQHFGVKASFKALKARWPLIKARLPDLLAPPPPPPPTPVWTQNGGRLVGVGLFLNMLGVLWLGFRG